MEKRALIAVLISVAILVLYQEVVLRRLYPRPPEQEVATEPTTQATAPKEATEAPAEEEPAAPPAMGQTKPVAEEHRVTVDTPLYRAVLTSVGARLKSFQLKKYRTTVEANSPPQETVVSGKNDELPFGVELRGQEVMSDAGAPYTVNGGDLSLNGGETGTVEFVWQTGGTAIHKRFAFQGDRYEFSLTLDASGVEHGYNEIGVSWARAVDPPPQPDSEVVFDRAVFLEGRKLTEDVFAKLSAGKILAGNVGWTGYAGRHFLAAMIPVDSQNHRLWLKLRDQTVEEMILFPLSDPARYRLDAFIGPKDFDALQGVGHDLSRAVDLGYFGFIAVPLLHELSFSHTLTHNYGLDIVLLTILIKVLFIPLTQRSFRSMREMQKLQPQMAKIRERFKDNSEQMNKEIMELYRRHKVNPLGGCLPMVLQIPVFIGLYSALGNAVELRHAPFFLWINDLSAPDRLGTLQLPFVEHPGIPVLTLLMGVSMFVQQWMTPSAADPAQQRAMMIMPLVFTFMFVNFPSGLALYWLVNNLLTIAQQYYMNRSAT